jgi:hypothetical protein
VERFRAVDQAGTFAPRDVSADALTKAAETQATAVSLAA